MEIKRITNKKVHLVLFMLLCIVSLSVSSAYYTGTGFTHSKADNYYDSYSTQDILGKYENTYLTSEERAVCTKVVDGDTIYLSNGKKVRLVGVNTPEKGVAGCQASKRFVEKLCLNKEVGINADDRKYTDKYGRTLAVVIVDGKNLNEMLLKEGLAEVMFIPPSEFSPYKWAEGAPAADHVTTTDTSTSVESSSSTNNLASSSSDGYVGNINSQKFHKPDCKGVSKMSDKNKVYFSSRQDAIDKGYQACHICNP